MAKVRRAISIRQPAAELILRGLKRFEYRTVRTNIRERVYIYASLTEDDPWPYGWRLMGCAQKPMPTGVIIGSVEIVACNPRPSKNGYAYKLANPRRVRPYLRPKNHPQPVFWIPQFYGVTTKSRPARGSGGRLDERVIRSC